MGAYVAKPEVDKDLVTHARWIELDNPEAAQRFLDAAFKSFEFLATFPEAGPKGRFKNERLKDIRFGFCPRHSIAGLSSIGSNTTSSQ